MKQLKINDFELYEKIDKALDLITVDQYGNWFVPNRKQLNFSIEEFAIFEKERLKQFNNPKFIWTKYKNHYEN